MRSTGEKKWMPMKRERSLNDSASEVIGSVEVLEPKIAFVADDVLRARDHFFLDLAVLEHRLDDEIAILQFDKIGGRLDARQHRVAVGGGGAAAVDLLGHQLLRMLLALLRGLRIAIDQHHVEAGERADIGDAGAHEARAEHADRLEFFRRHRGGTARALVDAPASRRTASGSSPPLPASAGSWRTSATRRAAPGPSAAAGPRRPPA